MNVKHLAQYLTPYRHTAAAAAAKSLQLCPTLCDPIDGSPPGSSVPGILQARILEWVAISFCNACMHAKSLQSCPTLCHPTDSSPPGFPLPGILQARTLEWVDIALNTPKHLPLPGPHTTQWPVWVSDGLGDAIICLPRGPPLSLQSSGPQCPLPCWLERLKPRHVGGCTLQRPLS